MLDIYLTNL